MWCRYWVAIEEFGETKEDWFTELLKLEHAIRAHWAVENNLHWVLDMAFDEDSNRTRQGYSALNLIKNEKSSKVGVKTKRLKAGWNDDYLLKIIGEFKPDCAVLSRLKVDQVLQLRSVAYCQ